MTVTVNEQLDETLPLASVAVQLTDVTPFGKVDPDGGVQAAVAPGQLSLAVAAKLTVAEQRSGAVEVLMLAGQLTVGFSLSFTVTVNEQLSLLFAGSCAVQVTVVVPFGNDDPDGGEH